MVMSSLCPSLASRLTAVSSSELASALSAVVAYGPSWPWAWMLPQRALAAVAQTLVLAGRMGHGMAGRPH